MKTLTQFKMALSKVNPFASRKFTSIGKRLSIYKSLFVNGQKYVWFGNHITFLLSAWIYKFDSCGTQISRPSIEFGDNTTFQQNFHLISAGTLKIDDGCVFPPYVSSCNHNISGIDPNVVLNAPLTMKDTIIENDCFVGMRT